MDAAIITQILVALPPTILALATLVNSIKNNTKTDAAIAESKANGLKTDAVIVATKKNTSHIDEVHASINGKMQELLEVSKAQGRADEQRDQDSANLKEEK